VRRTGQQSSKPNNQTKYSCSHQLSFQKKCSHQLFKS